MSKNNAPPYSTQYSRRKTLAIHLIPDYPEVRMEVRAPLRCPRKTIEEFVQSKQTWIEKHMQRLRQDLSQSSNPSQSMDSLPFQGKEFPVREGRKCLFDGESFYLPSTLFDSNADVSPLISLYQRLALPTVKERVDFFAPLIGVHPKSVKISRACRRWGSCSGKNALNFSWMLATVSPCLVDYVVVHELCHIREHNHSAAFWQLVAQYLPAYDALRKELRTAEQRLKSISR